MRKPKTSKQVPTPIGQGLRTYDSKSDYFFDEVDIPRGLRKWIMDKMQEMKERIIEENNGFEPQKFDKDGNVISGGYISERYQPNEDYRNAVAAQHYLGAGKQLGSESERMMNWAFENGIKSLGI